LITVADASAVLLLCLGLALLVVGCCAALILARTRLAPHADCKRTLAQFEGILGEVIERQKRAQKTKAGVSGGRPVTKPVEGETRSGVATDASLSDEDLQKQAQSRLRGMLNGGGM